MKQTAPSQPLKNWSEIFQENITEPLRSVVMAGISMRSPLASDAVPLHLSQMCGAAPDFSGQKESLDLLLHKTTLWWAGRFERVTHTQTTPSHWITSHIILHHLEDSGLIVCMAQRADRDAATRGRSPLISKILSFKHDKLIKSEDVITAWRWCPLLCLSNSEPTVTSFTLKGRCGMKKKAMNFWPVIQTAEEALQLGGNQSPSSTPSPLNVSPCHPINPH